MKYSELITGQRGRDKNIRRDAVFLMFATLPCLATGSEPNTALIKWPLITSLFLLLCMMWLNDLWIYQFTFSHCVGKTWHKLLLLHRFASFFYIRDVNHCCSIEREMKLLLSAPPCTCGSSSCTQVVTDLCSFRFMQLGVISVFLSYHICTPSAFQSVADKCAGFWSCRCHWLMADVAGICLFGGCESSA